MVNFAPLVGAAVLLSSFAAALPTQQQNSYNYGSSESGCGEKGCDSSKQYDSKYDGGKNYEDSSYKYTTPSYEKEEYTTEYEKDKYTTEESKEYTTSEYEKEYTTEESKEYTTSEYEKEYTTEESKEYTTTSMMEEKTEIQSTSTTSSYNSYETPSYGSGSSYWGGQGYNDCVNQCMAEFGSTGGMYQASETTGSEGSRGTGATHTVIVAPSDGVLRMVPFATNASVGDTIEFHWGATTKHTVTKSSALTPCNKSNEDPVFASGQQGKGFVFTQAVNDTEPTFYFCGVPGHCDKGMFGVINPKMAAPGAPSSIGGMMAEMASSDADLSAYAAYSDNITASNNAAATWGTNLDLADIPEASRSEFAKNVVFTRALLGLNGEILKEDNSVDLSSASTTPLMIPMDIGSALNAASSPSSSQTTTDSATTSAPEGAAANAAETPAAPSNGASSVTSSRLLVAAFVVVATVFAL
ncbi:Phytocyanin domain-containing protein [Mycena kentingensis (nom. inval.)]|nr:Phytocyanin domain-containing protein [Mycena kentingensis (nom. inval.)]